MEKIIDTTTTMEEILENTQLSKNIGRGFLGKNSDFGKPVEDVGHVLQRLDKIEWKETEKTDPLSSALAWHKKRISKDRIEQVMAYDDCKILFANFWANHLPEDMKFYVHPENAKHVQNILKWAHWRPHWRNSTPKINLVMGERWSWKINVCHSFARLVHVLVRITGQCEVQWQALGVCRYEPSFCGCQV